MLTERYEYAYFDGNLELVTQTGWGAFMVFVLLALIGVIGVTTRNPPFGVMALSGVLLFVGCLNVATADLRRPDDPRRIIFVDTKTPEGTKSVILLKDMNGELYTSSNAPRQVINEVVPKTPYRP